MRKFIFSITILFLFSLLQNCTVTKIPCEHEENGKVVKEIVVVQNHPERQYKQVVITTTTNIKGAIDILNKIKLSPIDVDVKRNVTELRDKLDQFSSRTENIIKASYNALQTAPCDLKIRSDHSKLLQDINKRNFALETLKSSLLAISDNGSFRQFNDGDKIELILEKYKTNTGDTSLKFIKPTSDSVVTLNNKDSLTISNYSINRGWFFDDEVNGAKRVKNDAQSVSYTVYPSYSDVPLKGDSLNLNNDFVVEVICRSLKSDYGRFGFIYNQSGSNKEIGYFLISTNSDKTVTLSAGLNWDWGTQTFEKLIFKTKTVFNISNYHKLQIKKSKEFLYFYFDNSKLFETNNYRIESPDFRLFVGQNSDVLFDGLSFHCSRK